MEKGGVTKAYREKGNSEEKNSLRQKSLALFGSKKREKCFRAVTANEFPEAKECERRVGARRKPGSVRKHG